LPNLAGEMGLQNIAGNPGQLARSALGGAGYSSGDPTRSAMAPGMVAEADYEGQERCRAALVKLPCSIRSAVAQDCPDWGRKSWSDRFALVRQSCVQQGVQCEDIVAAPPPPNFTMDFGHLQTSHQQRASEYMQAPPQRWAPQSGSLPPLPPPMESPPVTINSDQMEPAPYFQATSPFAHASYASAASPSSESWQLSKNLAPTALEPFGHSGLRQRDMKGHIGGGNYTQGTLRNMTTPRTVALRSDLDRLKAVFAYSDSLQVLISHHTDKLGQAVIDGMRQRAVVPGEVLIRQGYENQRLYIVDEGTFDVLIHFGEEPPVKVCEYGPGMVFGEHAMLSTAPRAATVVATSPAKIWFLERDAFKNILKAPDESKTIGLVGGVMLLINNLAGPTIVSMPALAQEAGWLSVVLVQVIVAAFAVVCGYMLIGAMRRMPGNGDFEQRVEFSNLAKFYLPHEIYLFVMLCYHSNSILSLMSLIIQSGQVIDYVILNLNGCSPGLDLGAMAYVCGTRTDSVTPFGDINVLSSSMIIVGVICTPFAMKNLDDNVVLQYIAIAGLSVMAVIWVWILVSEPAFPTPLPMVTAKQGGLIGTVLFNFAFTSALPSWVNEKGKNVSIKASFGITMGYVVIIYTVIAIIGGMAYKPFYMTDENLFSKLNAGGSKLGRATVTAYPMLQNFTSIPVFSIMIRYNLMQSGVSSANAILTAVALPWVLSIAMYTGSGFDTISEVGGLATSSVINFLIPAVLYVLARGRTSETLH